MPAALSRMWPQRLPRSPQCCGYRWVCPFCHCRRLRRLCGLLERLRSRSSGGVLRVGVRLSKEQLELPATPSAEDWAAVFEKIKTRLASLAWHTPRLGACVEASLAPLPDGRWVVTYAELYVLRSGQSLRDRPGGGTAARSEDFAKPSAILRLVARTFRYPAGILTAPTDIVGSYVTCRRRQSPRLVRMYGLLRKRRKQKAQEKHTVEQTSETTDTAATTTNVMTLLHRYHQRPGCERYRTEGSQLELLQLFLWFYVHNPNLSFADFLDLHQAVADYSDENLKHPAAAMDSHLPRRKALAEAQGSRQWTVHEALAFGSLYVQMIDEAAASRVPVPLSPSEFFGNAALKQQFEAGDFAEAVRVQRESKEATPRRRSDKKGEAVEDAVPASGNVPPTPEPPADVTTTTSAPTRNVYAPTQSGQRVLYRAAGEQEFRGLTRRVYHDDGTNRTYTDLHLDDGRYLFGVNVSRVFVISDPPPRPLTEADGQPAATLADGQLRIPAAELADLHRALALTMPVGNAELGAPLKSYRWEFTSARLAAVDLVNGEHGPYIDPAMLDPTKSDDQDQTLVELHPRSQTPCGVYQFHVPGEGIYRLEILPA